MRPGEPRAARGGTARSRGLHPRWRTGDHREYVCGRRAGLERARLGGHVAEANVSAIGAALAARQAAATGPVAVAGSMSSFCPAMMDAGDGGPPPGGPAPGDSRFPGLADFREQAQLLARAGADLIALEMIGARGYGSAALQAAAETGLPVWLGITAIRRGDGTRGHPARAGRR